LGLGFGQTPRCSLVVAQLCTQASAFETLPKDTDNSDQYFVQVSLRWHEILDRFRLELPRLKHFALSNDATAMHKAFENPNDLISQVGYSRYFTFDYEMGPMSWLGSHEMVRGEDDDEG
jgi:hypothetical protein